MLLLLQYFSINPPDEKDITFVEVFFKLFKTDNTSVVFPETLVAITSVFESTVFIPIEYFTRNVLIISKVSFDTTWKINYILQMTK